MSYNKYNKKWKHPASHTEYGGLYYSWRNMLVRAHNKRGDRPTYSDVSVCDRWLNYDNFFEDMSSTWWAGATLDKDITKPGNRVYCPEYCKWVSKSENIADRNRRNIQKGADNPNAKSYRCIETGEIVRDSRAYCKKYNLPKHAISDSANPKNGRKLANGYHWEYYNECLQ